MKATLRLLPLAIFFVVLTLTSCNKDENNGLSKTDATTEINEFNTSAAQDLQALTDADGLQALKEFFQLADTDDPFSRIGGHDRKSIKVFFRNKGKEFRSVFATQKAVAGRTQGDEPFDYSAHKGLYAWNASLQKFELVGQSDIIRIQFPTEGSPTNNAELKLSAYSEVEIFDEEFEESYYQPSVLKASLLVNQVQLASIDLNIQWHDSGIPITADIIVFVKPFTAILSFDDSNTSSSSLSVSLVRDLETIAAVSVTAKYKNSTKTAPNLTAIEGFVQLKNLKLAGSINISGMDASLDGDPNKYVHLALYSDGKKVGDIIFINENVNGFPEFVAYLRYSDGSKEKLENVFEPVMEELEELTEGLDDNG
ncbi:MAG: hypothetical protein ACOYXT_23835 [Bacteroidota bacterium]